MRSSLSESSCSIGVSSSCCWSCRTWSSMFSSFPPPMNSRSATSPSLEASTTSCRSSPPSSAPSSSRSRVRSSGASVSRVSSATALNRSFIAVSHPLLSANLAINSLSSGNTSISSCDLKRMCRGLVNSRYRIIATTASPPVVMPLLSSAPHTGPTSGNENSPNWKDAPIQKQTPATRTFCRFCSDWITSRAPSTNRVPDITIRYPAITGPGMVLSSPDSLGRNAIAMKMQPMQYPTLREATPVVWVYETAPGLMMLGTVPAMPASRLVAPAPANAPCTCRKSTARSCRHATLCWVMASPLA